MHQSSPVLQIRHRICHQAGDRLFVQLTERCTLECRFCPRTLGSRRAEAWDLGPEHRPAIAEVLASIGDPRLYREVVFSGLGEPTLRLNVLLAVARGVKQGGRRVRVETDGLANLVHDRNVLPAMAGVVDALSVAMNAPDQDSYEHLCRPNLPGSFAAMLAFLADAQAHVPQVKATAIAGLAGVDLAACAALAGPLGTAIGYALGLWPQLTTFREDGHIPSDNNVSENAIRPFVIARKGWLVSGSPRGAQASATLYSLIETAKANALGTPRLSQLPVRAPARGYHARGNPGPPAPSPQTRRPETIGSNR